MFSNSNDSTIKELKAYIAREDFEGAIQYLNNNSSIPVNIKQYNLAFLEYKQGNLVTAKKLFEQARLNGMFTQEANHALKKVNEELQIDYIEPMVPTTENILLQFKILPIYSAYLIYGVMTSLVLFSLVKRWLGLFIPALLSLVGVMTFHYHVEQLDFEYIEKESIVRRGPSKIFEETNLIPPGVKVLTSKKSDQWVYIEYPSIFTGWMKKEDQ